MKNKNHIPDNFQDRIKRLRLDRLWTLKQMAATIGVTSNAILAWERGRVLPTELSAEKIRRAFPQLFEDAA